MDSGKRNLLIAVAVVAAAVAAGFIVHAMSGKSGNGDEKAYMTAIKNQVQQKKPAMKLDKASVQKMEADIQAAVAEGKITAEQAEKKRAWVRGAIEKRKQAGAKKAGQ